MLMLLDIEFAVLKSRKDWLHFYISDDNVEYTNIACFFLLFFSLDFSDMIMNDY